MLDARPGRLVAYSGAVSVGLMPRQVRRTMTPLSRLRFSA